MSLRSFGKARSRRVLCLAGASVVVLAWAAAGRAQSVRGATLTLDPDTGPPGQAFTIVGIGYAGCAQVRLQWDGDTPIPTVPREQGVDTIEATFAVPADETPGLKSVEAFCFFLPEEEVKDDPPVTSTPCCTEPTDSIDAPVARAAQSEELVAAAPFTVTAAPTPDDTAPVATPSPGVTPTLAPSASPTPGVEIAQLVLDKPAVEPGGRVLASGTGCKPSKPVRLELDGAEIATVDAGVDGRFVSPVVLAPGTEIGRHLVTARCGGLVLAAPLDVVVNEQNSTAPVAPVVTFALFLFAALEAKDFLEKERSQRPPRS